MLENRVTEFLMRLRKGLVDCADQLEEMETDSILDEQIIESDEYDHMEVRTKTDDTHRAPKLSESERESQYLESQSKSVFEMVAQFSGKDWRQVRSIFERFEKTESIARRRLVDTYFKDRGEDIGLMPDPRDPEVVAKFYRDQNHFTLPERPNMSTVETLPAELFFRETIVDRVMKIFSELRAERGRQRAMLVVAQQRVVKARKRLERLTLQAVR